MKDKDIILSGDGQCDSPGQTAKYCTYSLMDIDTGYILHSETVDKRKVALKSPNMEKEPFVRSLQFLQTHISCKEIITDASTSIRTEMGKPKRIIGYTVYTDVYSQLQSILIYFISWTCGTSLRN